MCMNNRDQVLVEELKNGKRKHVQNLLRGIFRPICFLCQQPTSLGRECKDVVHMMSF